MQAPDCGQVNLMLCQDAEAAYERAAMFAGKVFEDAKGNACTYCDIGRIGSVVRLLLDRETYFRDNPGHDVSLSWLWNDWQSWSLTPTCQALGTPPLPDCGATGSYPPSRLNASPGLAMSGAPYMNECEGRCDQNDWCRSFDFDANGGACLLHDRTRDEAGLLPAPGLCTFALWRALKRLKRRGISRDCEAACGAPPWCRRRRLARLGATPTRRSPVA